MTVMDKRLSVLKWSSVTNSSLVKSVKLWSAMCTNGYKNCLKSKKRLRFRMTPFVHHSIQKCLIRDLKAKILKFTKIFYLPKMIIAVDSYSQTYWIRYSELFSYYKVKDTCAKHVKTVSSYKSLVKRKLRLISAYFYKPKFCIIIVIIYWWSLLFKKGYTNNY